MSVYDLSHFRIRNDDGTCLENPKYVEPSMWFYRDYFDLFVLHQLCHYTLCCTFEQGCVLILSTDPPACTSVDLVTGGNGMIKMQQALNHCFLRAVTVVSKPDIITNVYCEKSIVSDPLTIEDEVELTCQRSKFVLDSSSNEYEMSVGLSIS